MASLEEYLLEQLDRPLVVKGGQQVTDEDGHPLTTEEAIAKNLINKALKGDIATVQYIQNMKQLARTKKRKNEF